MEYALDTAFRFMKTKHGIQERKRVDTTLSTQEELHL